MVQALEPETGGLFIDCTLGLGGHSEALLAANPDLRLLGIDRDDEALRRARARLATFGTRFRAVKGEFETLTRILQAEADFVNGPIRGIVADLGVSSMQLEAAERGFSFQYEGPLDMRMDREQGETAATLVNRLPESELADLIYQYGEEPASRAIARRIVKERAVQPIETTTELARIVAGAVGRRGKPGKQRIHPATKTFQALRIAVNGELVGLEQFVADGVEALAAGGRLAVITFHSLEDRLIKNAMRFAAGQCRCPAQIPVCVCGARARVSIVTKKPIVAEDAETADNPRARSAKLRVCEKL